MELGAEDVVSYAVDEVDGVSKASNGYGLIGSFAVRVYLKVTAGDGLTGRESEGRWRPDRY